MTDLTGTKWRFHAPLDFSALNAPLGEYYREFSLDFTTAKNENCTQMNFDRGRWFAPDAELHLYFGLTRSAYNYGRWETLRDEITISGGADATNPTLIEFITSNAEPYDFYRAEKHDLIAVADAIRAKGGTSEALTFPQGFVDAIGDISGGQYGNELISVLDGSARELRNLPSALTKIKPYAFYRSKNLPDGYVPLESVRANGNTVIQTEIPYNNISSITFEASLDGPLSHSQVVLGFERGGNGGTYFGAMPSKAIWSVGTGTSNEFTVSVQDRTRISIAVSVAAQPSITATINGVSKTRIGSSFVTSYTYTFTPIQLFGVISRDGTVDYPSVGTIYGSVKAMVLNVIAYEYVPVKRLSDSAIGLFDVVNGNFILPTGDPLIPGPEIEFEEDSSLEIVDLGENVIKIGEYAFTNNNLRTLTLRASQVVELGDNALKGTLLENIYVPESLVESYKSEWSEYSSIIRSIE